MYGVSSKPGSRYRGENGELRSGGLAPAFFSTLQRPPLAHLKRIGLCFCGCGSDTKPTACRTQGDCMHGNEKDEMGTENVFVLAASGSGKGINKQGRGDAHS